jgi:hypothetical protein
MFSSANLRIRLTNTERIADLNLSGRTIFRVDEASTPVAFAANLQKFQRRNISNHQCGCTLAVQAAEVLT